jgi:hypothetical protein
MQFATYETRKTRENGPAALRLLGSNPDICSAVVIEAEAAGGGLDIAKRPKPTSEQSRQTFVVTDLLSDLRYIVISDPEINTLILAPAGQMAIVTTGANADVSDVAFRTIQELRLQRGRFRGS